MILKDEDGMIDIYEKIDDLETIKRVEKSLMKKRYEFTIY